MKYALNNSLLYLAVYLSTFSAVVFGESDEKQVCYDELGCFPTSDPWSSVFRPGFPAPESPEEIGFTLTFFTRNTGPSILDGHTLGFWPEIKFNDTDFDADRSKTYFITHGYFASGNSSWMSDMKDELLKKEDANVFIVDWGKGAATINYFQAASNTRVVGAEIARFIEYAKKKYKLNTGRIHLIGHSLGAHISSYAGKRVPGIGRITGLDPAQPGFEGTGKEVRLDKSDANFVDVYHTNIRPVIPTLGFGMISAVGHVDIYFNGGIDQPGCLIPKNLPPIASLADIAILKFKVLAHFISCSHTKAYHYFTATINNDCNIWARRAGSFRSLINAVTFGNIEPITASILKCSKKACTASGFRAPFFSARGVFAANTIRGYPFCDSDPDLDRKIHNELGLEEEEDEKGFSESTTEKDSSSEDSSRSMITDKIPQVFKDLKSDVLDKPIGSALSKTKSVASKFPFL